MMQDLIDRFLSHLLYEKGYSKNTLESYKNDFVEFLFFLSERGLNDIHSIRYQDLYHYLSRLGEMGLKNSSIERKTASLKSFFKYLLREGVISKNPAALVSSPKKEKRLPSVLEKVEILSLLSSIPETDARSIRNKAMLTILYAGGFRVSEMSGLDLTDVDYREGMVRVLGKGGKERIVPIGETAGKTLIRYLSWRKELEAGNNYERALFLTKSGKRIQDRMVRYILARYLDELSIQKHVSPHTLRHTFATHMLENGASIRVIQEMLGHASLSTTQVYTHLTIEKLKESYNEHHPHA